MRLKREAASLMRLTTNVTPCSRGRCGMTRLPLPRPCPASIEYRIDHICGVTSAAPHHQTALPKVDTDCTTPPLIPTANGNTVRSFSTHGQQSSAKGSSTTVSRSDIRLIQHLDSSAHGLVWRGRS
jgi:hypothetical protein